jgi:alcohol dehydrogenase
MSASLARRVWRIERAGSLDRLELREEALPPPRAGEARVRVMASGVNFADLFAAQGLYSATPRGAFIPGLECAGIVEALGSSAGASASAAHSVCVGDRVIALTRFGGYATALNVGVEYLWPLPEDWSFEDGAAYPVQALTAWYGLTQLGALREGAVVLVQSAAGGVGLNALEILRVSGARAVAIVGSEAKRTFLIEHRALDPRCVIVRDRRRFASQLDAALEAVSAKGFDLVFDAVLGPFFRPAFERLAPEGRYVLYGAADFMSHGARPSYPKLAWQYLRRPRLDPLAMIAANRSLMAFNLIWLWGESARLPAALRATLALIPRPPPIGEGFPFERAPDAVRALQGGRTIGKIVLARG